MALRPYPLDALEHEAETLSAFLRSFADCPQEVRIREVEGSLIRPMILLTLVSAGVEDESRYHFWEHRVARITFYGTDETLGTSGKPTTDKFLEAKRAAEWISTALARDVNRGMIRIKDFSDIHGAESVTESWIDVDSSTIIAQPLQDDFGHWIVPVNFTYKVDQGEYIPGGPLITTINTQVTV